MTLDVADIIINFVKKTQKIANKRILRPVGKIKALGCGLMIKNLFPLQITKRIYVISVLVTIVPILLVTALIQVSFFNHYVETNEKNLYIITHVLEKKLNGTFKDILQKHNALDKTKEQQALIINNELQSKISDMVEAFPGYTMGYYSLELGRRVAIGPNFSPDKLAPLPPDSPYLNMYKTGRPVVQKVSSTLIWKSEPLLSMGIPIYRDNKLIGHVFARTKLRSLRNGLIINSWIIILVGCLIALAVCILGWWLVKSLKNELELFSKAVVEGDSGQVTQIIPELNPIIDLVKERTEKMESTVKQLEGEINCREAIEKELVRDINERKNAEEKILFQASILEHVRNAVIVTDFDGIVVYWNRFAEILYGWKAEEILNENIMSKFKLIPENTSIDGTLVKNSIIQKGYWEGEGEVVTKDGRNLCVHRMVTYIRNGDGSPKGIICVETDLTERKKLEKEMVRLDKLHMIGEMAAGIGHEVRNPMTTVRGFMQLLAVKEKNSVKREQFNLMIEELDRANSIITEYLSLAKNKKVELKPGNLNDVLNNLYPLLVADAMVSDKYVITEFGRIPEILLDEKEISQLILNLVRNGLEAMSPGGTVTIKTYPEGLDTVLLVKDEGTGVDPQILERLGTPFVTTKDTGTGLGLAVSYSIVERHNGKITVDTGGTGTTFSIRFPSCQKVPDEIRYSNVV